MTLLPLAAYCGSSDPEIFFGYQTGYSEMDAPQLDSAIAIISVRHFKKPANQLFIRQLAEAYTAKDQTDSALAYWHLFSSIGQADEIALSTQAQLYYSIDSLDSAAVFMHRAIDMGPDRVEYLSFLSLIDYRLHRPDTALSVCQRILSLAPSDVHALLLSGMVLRDQNKHAEALEQFNKCLKADPANTDALMHRADEFVFLKKYNDALRDYSAARADLSDDADILNNIGICYFESGEYQQAISFFRKAIAIDHQHPQSYFNQGLSYYHLHQLDTASIDIKTASAIWDTSHTDTSRASYQDAIYYLGMCYKNTGDLAGARTCFVLLQKEKYPTDLSPQITAIDRALFISQNWYYFLLLIGVTIGLIIVLVRMMTK